MFVFIVFTSSTLFSALFIFVHAQDIFEKHSNVECGTFTCKPRGHRLDLTMIWNGKIDLGMQLNPVRLDTRKRSWESEDKCGLVYKIVGAPTIAKLLTPYNPIQLSHGKSSFLS